MRGGWRLAKLDINSDGLNGISGVTETDVIFAATAFLFLLGVQFCRDTTLTPAAGESHCTRMHEEAADDAALTLCQTAPHRPLGVTVPI